MEPLPATTVSDYEPIANNEERKQLVRNLLCKQATDSELVMFSMACDKAKLDPFSRQIYITKYGGRMTIITGIDGFRVIAQRSGQYLGQKGPFWCGEEGEWKEVPYFYAKEDDKWKLTHIGYKQTEIFLNGTSGSEAANTETTFYWEI